ncbi:hypothetical protein C5167_048695 [Papaver somniferum]|uniref:DUF7054 domain-containing protein n=1 Tax=Papaver somniferum TaxID=3469 RepID=A0A4Y7KK21_PAPSO|nr:uncharacterized protein At4g22758-like [Papaver somniferum]RZC73216.1 hypothetical protein C5167_048695 [Papaver somniferum]
MSSSTSPTQQLAAVGGRETTSDHRSMKIRRLEINPKGMDDNKKKLTKLLLNVTIERSLGPVQVITSSEKSVEELIKSALEIYVKEKRRPLLIETNPNSFELHYSQFCLESLNPAEKLISLGSRNFFLCLKPTVIVKSISCSNEANQKEANKSSYFMWTRFMDFLP